MQATYTHISYNIVSQNKGTKKKFCRPLFLQKSDEKIYSRKKVTIISTIISTKTRVFEVYIVRVHFKLKFIYVVGWKKY